MSIILGNGNIENRIFQSPFAYSILSHFFRRSFMKKTAFLLLLFFFYISVPSYGSNDIVQLTEAFKCSESSFSEAKISGWVKVNESGLDIDEVQKTISTIYGNDEPSVKDMKESVERDDERVTVRRDYGDFLITADFIELSSRKSNKTESVLAVDITQYKDMENITGIRERLTNCLKIYSPKPQVNVSVTGYIDGNVEKLKRQELIEGIFSYLDAQKVEGIKTENL
jgi:hypothetical protein